MILRIKTKYVIARRHFQEERQKVYYCLNMSPYPLLMHSDIIPPFVYIIPRNP
jgi:hypothetical protein